MLMNVAVLPSPARYSWDWLALLLARRNTLSFALLGGLLSLTAVQMMRIECRTDDQVLLSDSGLVLTSESGEYLVTGNKDQRCQLVVGRVRLPLSSGF